MKTAIAIFLLLKAVSNGIKLPQRDGMTKSEYIGYAFVQFVLMALHFLCGLWLLLNQ